MEWFVNLPIRTAAELFSRREKSGFRTELSEFGLTGFQQEADQGSARRRVAFRPACRANPVT
jgi:hypothetical protein